MARRTRKTAARKKSATRPPVIELQAEEVASDAAGKAGSGKAADHRSDGSDQKDAGSAGRMTEPEVSESAADTGEASAGADAASANGDSSSRADDGATAKPEEDPGDPAQPSGAAAGDGKKGSSKRLVIATCLIALLAAGGAGAWTYRHYANTYLAGPVNQQIEALSQRVAALESAAKVREQAIGSVRSGLEAVKGDLARLSGAVTSRDAVSPADLEATAGKIGERLDGLAAQLREVDKTAKKANEQATQLRQAVDDAAKSEGAEAGDTALRVKLEALTSELTGLSARIDEVSATAKAAGPAVAMEEFGSLRGQVAQLKASLDGLVAERRAARNSQPVRLAEGLEAVRVKFAAGEPFARELDALAAIAPDLTGLDGLRPAAAGVATADQLMADLKQMAKVHTGSEPDAKGSQAELGVLGTLKSKFTSVVKIRRIEDADWQAALEEAVAALDGGGLAEAVARLQREKHARPDAVKVWLEKAEVRLEAGKALTKLTAGVLNAVSAASN